MIHRLAVRVLPLGFTATALVAGIVPAGSGSYTTTLPAPDAAGRNTIIPGTPNLSGAALGKPVPTNDWWSNFLKNSFGGNCFNYPLSFRSLASGLVVNYTVPRTGPREYREPMSDVQAVVVGTNNLAASKASVSNYSDWTVTLNWDDKFSATLGQGMPFTYYTKASSEVAKIAVNFNAAGVTVSGNKLIIQSNMNGSNYVVYAPAGSTWSGSGGVYTSTLNGKNYWSMALLPPGADVASAAADFEKYAFVFPGDTKVAWNYAPSTGKVRTTFSITPSVKEGSNNVVLQGLLPHQWAHLASDSAQPGSYAYKTVRGQMKMLSSNTFLVENTFTGVLPTLPNLAKYSDGFSSVPGFNPAALTSKLDQMKNDGLDLWTDSYNEGQAMNRLVQAARIADQLGYTAARDALINTVKTRLENWFTANSSEVAFLFYYNSDWTTLVGYPAGYSTDSNLNDHHFHWGYFINAAVAVEQFNPGWASKWGDMVNMLVRDTANPSRTDAMFPFLRNFNPYDGHAWGNGTASEPFGVDEESTPESMNVYSGLINWGLATGNTELRDLGVYLYTTEQTAVEEYWFDINRRTFQPEYLYPMVARVWAGGYDNGTWWTNALSGCYGIQMYPIHGGSLYLGHDTSYLKRVWTGLVNDTPVMSNVSAETDPNCWYDVFWCLQSFFDPEGALTGYNRWQGRSIKNGISDAATYHWLHTMHALGQVRSDLTADYPTATVFDKNGVKTYAAHNYGSQAITVHFSDGYSLVVPARSSATNRDINASATLSTSSVKIPANGTVTLTAATTGSGISKVEFYQDSTLLSTKTAAPYTFTTAALKAGLPYFYAKVYVGSNCNLSNIVKVQVGDQTPYGGTAPTLPGTIQAGDFDVFEGGFGQGVTYSDTSIQNVTAANGGQTWRPEEAVDAGVDSAEGHTVGWIDAGEWMTYTVNVSQAGTYKLTVNTASGNASGGGPFWFELNGSKITPDIMVPFTDTNWSSYQPTVVNNISLPAGKQTLLLRVGSSAFNLGRMKFEYTGTQTAPAITAQPASATVTAGQTATFSVTASGAAPLSYQWRKNGTSITGATSASYTTPATATADSGAKYSVVVSNASGSVTSGDATLTVNPANYTITASAGANGSISPNGNVSVAGGSNQAFTITPASGYVISSVTVDGSSVGAVSSYTFSNVSAAHSISAAFTSAPVSSNLALSRTAAASSSENASLPASLAVDGNTGTRWSSSFADPAWISVDLGSSQTFNRAVLRWEAAYGKDYQIQASNDNSTWTTVYTKTGGNGGTEDFTFPSTNARYIRMYGTARGTVYGYSLYEFEVYNSNVGVAPSITAQPASKTVTAGQTASFSVTASGTAPLSYQWKKNGSAITGATSATYTTAATTTSDNASKFSVVVSNTIGSVTSSEATLTVNSAVVAPSITTQPQSASLAAGATATFSVTASGTAPLSYQWRKNGTAISGATSASYTTPAATASDNGAKFSVVITNAAGSVTSVDATLTVAVATATLIDDFNSATRWNNRINSLGKAITTNGGLYNLEGDADLYFFFNGGTTAESFTTRIDKSLSGLSNLVLVISGGNGGEETAVTLVLNDGTDHSVKLSTYGTLTTSYKTISIPLSAFGANLASTAFLRVEGRGTAKTIRIDSINVQ